jgi:hypothetical protein
VLRGETVRVVGSAGRRWGDEHLDSERLAGGLDPLFPLEWGLWFMIGEQQ